MFYAQRHDSHVFLGNMPFMTLYVLFSLTVVNAVPVLSTREDDTNGNSSRKISSIWIPIVVVVVVLMALAVMLFFRKSIRSAFAKMHRGVVNGVALSSGTTLPGSNTNTGSRELTAEQLAGSIRGADITSNQRTRRARRPRRTPSQISTTSLPVYMKEPGEEETVIFRGPQDMEDVSIPAEIAEEGSLHSRNNSDARYSPVPDSPNNMPLLHNDEGLPASEFTGAHANTTVEGLPAQSSLLLPDGAPGAPQLDPRGATPSYYEVVDLSHDNLLPLSQSISIEIATPPGVPAPNAPAETPQSGNVNRRSTFRSIFGALNNRAPGPSTHTRGQSNVSMSNSSGEGSASSHPRTSTTTHRPSHSGSSILSNFRSSNLRRQRSTNTLNSANNLTSPSMISLNSISAPLSHTLVRTEFTYPKTGPTPEQLKLISSRESFARFGMPYGADAIAFAASTSRMELHPPPDFEESISRGGSSLSLANRPDTRQSGHTGEGSEESEEYNSGHLAVEPENGASNVTDVPSRLASISPEPDQRANNDVAHDRESTVHDNVAVQCEETVRGLEPATIDSADVHNNVTESEHSTVEHAVVTDTSAGNAQLPASKPPPSAFKEAAPRSVSRASSVNTFATAQDTLRPDTVSISESQYYSEDYQESASGASTPTHSMRSRA